MEDGRCSTWTEWRKTGDAMHGLKAGEEKDGRCNAFTEGRRGEGREMECMD